MAERPTKRQRIDEAREAARQAREKRERRQRRLKVLVPSLVSVAVLAIVAVVVVVVAIQPRPAPSFPGGPRNMASDGIVYQQTDGESQPVTTPALRRGQTPQPTDVSADQDTPHVVTYIDLSCPACRQFEETNASMLQQMVAQGQATLEIKPIAILDSRFTGQLYSTRAANVVACTANYAPSRVLDVVGALYDNQAEEGSAGLSNDRLISIVHDAGVTNERIDACIRGTSYRAWVTAATERATSDASLQGTQGFSTPTVTVNGNRWDGASDLQAFIRSGGEASGS